MFPTTENANKNTQQVSWEQRLLKNAGRQKTNLKPEYQELKFTLHRKLVDKIISKPCHHRQPARPRRSAPGRDPVVIDAEPTLLSSLENSRSATKSWMKSSAWGRSSRC